MPAFEIASTHPGLGWAGQLEPAWRVLEGVADGSFFQGWTWLGCNAAVRFDRPFLVTAKSGTALVGLALFNQPQRGGPLWLHETGRAQEDAAYIEHNAPMVGVRGPERAAVITAMLTCALKAGGVVHLAGVTDEVLQAARCTGGVVDEVRSQAALIVHLAGLASHEGFLNELSRNTRQQLRKAERLYGGLTVRRAETVDEALQYFSGLVRWHTQSWSSRGKSGAFATQSMLSFHRALIERGVGRGEVDLLRIEGSSGLAGFLYNFRSHGRVLAYQSGFVYDAITARHKPGLSCHAAAIGWYRERGLASYDLLAGESQYKRSLAHEQKQLHWLVLARPYHPRAWLTQVRRAQRSLELAFSLHRFAGLRDVAVGE